MSAFASRRPIQARAGFAALGGSRLAYIRAMRSEQVALLCPDAPMLRPGLQVFVLHAADGTPIFITDTHEAALANAASEQLEAVSVH